MDEPRMLRREQVERRVGLGKSAIYKLIAEGDFPRPLRLTPGAVRWRVEEVDAWLATRERATGSWG